MAREHRRSRSRVTVFLPFVSPGVGDLLRECSGDANDTTLNRISEIRETRARLELLLAPKPGAPAANTTGEG